MGSGPVPNVSGPNVPPLWPFSSKEMTSWPKVVVAAMADVRPNTRRTFLNCVIEYVLSCGVVDAVFPRPLELRTVSRSYLQVVPFARPLIFVVRYHFNGILGKKSRQIFGEFSALSV